ncbi:hypothetical protein CU254_42000 (plasmid) [Amycolatopsis sp. AA4]|uniref:hypothetical protein n=1 Tax=Actinomycetes TaxID=1760 RepID=UPI0001B56C16|nr:MULTISPECIES: hypothetical protein [Actinomycetes]ATY17153.1 hypothetical protein CU254_42000 [Amycolatopsis sp. AA4]EFL12617.1 predicted protein [Streptomyces sp. AA4]
MKQVALNELLLADIAKYLAHLVTDGDDTDNVTYYAEACEDRLVVTVGTYDEDTTREFELPGARGASRQVNASQPLGRWPRARSPPKDVSRSRNWFEH